MNPVSRISNTLAIAAVLCATAVSGWAQGDLPLSLNRAVQIALEPEGSTRVALAQQAIAQAEQQQALAKANFMPNLTGALTDRNQTVNLQTFGFNSSALFPGFNFPSLVGPFTVFDARASAQVPVFDYSTIRRYQATKAGVEVQRAQLDVTNTNVAEEVARAYLTTLRADAALETAQANVNLSEALEQQARSQLDAGTGTGIEVTRAQVQLADDRQRLTVAENDRRRAALTLLRTMGLDLDVPVQLTQTLTFDPMITEDTQTFLARAMEQRPELRLQDRREQAVQRDIDAVRAERVPTLAAFGDYGTIGRHGSGLRPTRQFGVTLNVPLWDGGRRKARTAEREVQLRQEELRTRDVREQIELDVRLALQSLESARTQVETAREGLDLAQDELAQAQRRFAAGVSIPLEVTDAQTRLDRARNNEINALYNYNVARLDLAAATGTLEEFVNQ